MVEVLSPSARERDRAVKWRRYAALGVSHYWLVDPEARRLECYRLEGAAYRLVVEGEGDLVLSHPDWPELSISLADLWR